MERNFKGFAVIIGISKYLHINSLPNTVSKDARDVADTFADPARCGYPPAQVKVLLDEEATLDNIRGALKYLVDNCDSTDTAIIFFSGHGAYDENSLDGQSFLLPYDFDEAAWDSTALSSEELAQVFREIRSERLLVVFDACHSGGVGYFKKISFSNSAFKSGLMEITYTQLSAGKGRAIMSSSRQNERSVVLSNMTNSLFTSFFLDALQGNARSLEDGLIRLMDVFNHVSTETPKLADQHPVLKAQIETDFPIALLPNEKSPKRTLRLEKPVAENVDVTSLRDVLVKHFNLDEVEIMCSDLQEHLRQNGVDLPIGLEISGGDSKERKVLNLIDYLNRRGYVHLLVRVVRDKRPGVF